MSPIRDRSETGACPWLARYSGLPLAEIVRLARLEQCAIGGQHGAILERAPVGDDRQDDPLAGDRRGGHVDAVECTVSPRRSGPEQRVQRDRDGRVVLAEARHEQAVVHHQLRVGEQLQDKVADVVWGRLRQVVTPELGNDLVGGIRDDVRDGPAGAVPREQRLPAVPPDGADQQPQRGQRA